MATNISIQINHDFSENATFNMLQNDGYPVYATGEQVKHFLRFNSSNINLTDSITQIKVSFQARIDSTNKPSINLGMCLAEYESSDSNPFVAFGSGSYSTGTDATQSPATQYAQCKTSVDISSTDWTSYDLYLKIPNNLLAGMLYYGVTDSSMRFSNHLGIAIGVKNNGSTSNIIQMSNLSVSVIHNTTSPTPTRTLSVTTSPSAGGSVSGGGTYNYASPATLIATPASNYTFARWMRDGVVVSNSSTYTINAVQLNETYIAVFTQNEVTPTTYYIGASASPSSGGTVSGTGSYTSGSTATLSASTNPGYSFKNWTENGSVVSTSSSYSFTVSKARTLVANFEAITTSYYISVSASPSSGGTVSGAGYYTSGSTATLSASYNSGYSFKNWTENGSVVSTSSNYSFTVSNNRTLVANFEAKTISLEHNIYVGNNGPFTLPATGLNAFPTFNQANCLKLKFVPNSSGTYTFSSTQSGTITTDPEAQLFDASGTTSLGTGRDENSNRQFKFTSTELTEGSTYYLMIGNWGSYSAADDFYVEVEQTSVTPETSYTLTVIDYYGHGGFSNISPSLGTHEYTAGTSIPLSVTLKTGYYTNGWDYKKETDTSWTTITSAATGTYIMPDCNVTICVDVLPYSYTITAQSNNTSYGTVSNSGGTYSYNSTFTSTATPNTNYQFDGWYKNGSLVTLSTQLSVIVSGDATYIAQFSKKKYTITYESDGGTSTPDPQEFYAGNSVTLASAIQKDSTITNPSYDFSTNFYRQDGTWVNGATTINQIIYPKKETSYTFKYWYDGSAYYYAGGSYTLSENKTFTATWNQSYSYTITAPAVSRNNSTVSRKITFDYNDGTSNNNSTATSSNTTSYMFKGWYDNTSGGNVKISSNGGSYNPSSGETLYAQWNSSSTGYSKVTFPAFSRDGYSLKGFADSSSATSIKYEAGQEAAVSGTWYAVWEPDILTISLDNKNATTNGTSTLYLKYDTGWYSNSLATTSISKITVPKRTGYTFQGYYTKENGEGTKIIDNIGNIIGTNNFTSDDDITLYVYWTINYYSITHSMNTDASIGNNYTVKDKSNNSIPSGSTYSYGSQIKLEATGNNLQGYDFLRWEINGSTVTASSYTFTLTKNTTIVAYFGKRNMSIIVNLYDENNNPFSIPPGEEDSYIKLWIRQLNDDDTYSSWEKKYFNAPIVYSQATNIQVIIQDGEDYEFVSSDNDKFNKYTNILINDMVSYSVYFKKIPEINSIYLGKSDKPYTSGYIDDPNLSFKEEISSIWVGGKQIMGKAPTRDYSYLEDTLLGNILYIGKNNSFINSYKDNLNIYKVIIPEGILNTGGQGFFGCSNLTSVILPKSLKSIGQHVFEGTGLKSLYLPNQVETLYTRALEDMQNLEKIVFPKNLKIIYANNGSQSKVSTINLFETNLEILKSGAFRGLYKLTTILLPDTLQSVEEEAFSSCYNLKKVIYKGTIEKWQNISIVSTGNEYLLNAIIYCKDGIINPKEEN